MPLLSEESLAKVHKFQYRGSDTSPIYQYILSPFAQFCVENFTPLWMAPNLITFIGLLSSLVSTWCVLIFNPTLGPTGPRWLALLTAICIFFYQTLDNMDGKQARRTGSSSALGMLFDHGCDAINAGLYAIPMGSALGTGWTVNIFFTLWCGFVPFYFQTWEEYYLGAMVLPPINGPSEGLLIAVGMCLCSYFNGAEFWHEAMNLEPYIRDLGLDSRISIGISMTPTRFEIMVIAAVIGALITVAIQTYKVLLELNEKKLSVVNPLLNLLPFLVFLPSCFVWCYYSEIALQAHPLMSLLLIGSTFTEMVSHIMLQHICDDTLHPFSRYSSYLIALLPLHIYYTINPNEYVSNIVNRIKESSVLFFLCGFSVLFTGSRLFMMCTEIAKTLKIKIFTLPKSKSSK